MSVPEHIQEVMGRLYPLADALQMELVLNERKGKKLRVVGNGNEISLVTGKREINFTPKIVASGVGKSDVWLLLHIKGSLWVFTGYLHDSKELFFWLLDADKAKPQLHESEAKVRYSGEGVIQMTSILRPACVEIYRRGRKHDAKWEKVGADRVGE